MSLPRAYKDPDESSALGGVEPFAKAHQLKALKRDRFSNPCSVIRYTNPEGLASLPHPPWYLTVTNNGRWMWWTCKSSVDRIRATNIC